MKNFLKENWFKSTILAALLLICISIAYYFLYFLPSKERTKETARKYCNQWSIDETGGNILRDRNQKNYNAYFERCLREQGVSN